MGDGQRLGRLVLVNADVPLLAKIGAGAVRLRSCQASTERQFGNTFGDRCIHFRNWTQTPGAPWPLAARSRYQRSFDADACFPGAIAQKPTACCRQPSNPKPTPRPRINHQAANAAHNTQPPGTKPQPNHPPIQPPPTAPPPQKTQLFRSVKKRRFFVPAIKPSGLAGHRGQGWPKAIAGGGAAGVLEGDAPPGHARPNRDATNQPSATRPSAQRGPKHPQPHPPRPQNAARPVPERQPVTAYTKTACRSLGFRQGSLAGSQRRRRCRRPRRWWQRACRQP